MRNENETGWSKYRDNNRKLEMERRKFYFFEEHVKIKSRLMEVYK